MTKATHNATATILVVDDERDLLAMLARFLRSEGYTILEAENPLQALSICSKPEHNIDLMLSDYKMPGMSGMELAKALREIRPSLRMVFMSGNSEGEEKLVTNGFRCLRKPFILTELAGVIQQALAVR